MLLAHRIELYPSAAQADYLDRACGSRRHCYNQLLAHFSQDGVKWSKTSAVEVYNRLRQQFEWYSEVSQRVTRNAIDDLDSAFKHFFRRVKTGEKPGYPRFKKRGINDSFALRESVKFDVEGRWLRIEKLKKGLRKLKKHQRRLSRKTKGSHRRAKAKLKVARIHRRIAHQRQAVLHELTDHLTETYHTICIEDLNVKGMVKNHCLARAISDAGFGMFRQFLEYKAKLRGNTLKIVDRWFPSSKTCSGCGTVNKELSLSERAFVCKHCGVVMDRDHNAAVNILNHGEDTLKPNRLPTTPT
jgi:putative transposase